MAEKDIIPLDLIQTDSQCKRTSDFLSENSKIGFSRNHCDKHPRCVNLQTQEMFNNLVNLYAIGFQFEWERYKSYMGSFPAPTGVLPHIYASRCYISMWFIDLYVSNRKFVKKLSCSAFIKHYQGKLYRVSHKYDHYLTLLNASIRPAYLKHNLDNALYIPIIVDSLNVNNPNPFGINNFTPVKIFYDFALVMNETKYWQFSPLSSEAMGRPCWLFDWHTDNGVYSWFSQEGNYDLEDVSLAYILGTACTPNLGYKDVDDWQYFAQGIIPQNRNPLAYDSVVERRFYGSCEVTTMEIDTDFSVTPPATNSNKVATAKKRKKGSDDQVMPRFKLIDWLYYHHVVEDIEYQARTRAHRIFDDIPEWAW